MLDDINARENAIMQLSCCCGEKANRDAVIYYVETLEEIIRQLTHDEPQMTPNQKEILEFLRK